MPSTRINSDRASALARFEVPSRPEAGSGTTAIISLGEGAVKERVQVFFALRRKVERAGAPKGRLLP